MSFRRLILTRATQKLRGFKECLKRTEMCLIRVHLSSQSTEKTQHGFSSSQHDNDELEALVLGNVEEHDFTGELDFIRYTKTNTNNTNTAGGGKGKSKPAAATARTTPQHGQRRQGNGNRNNGANNKQRRNGSADSEHGDRR